MKKYFKWGLGLVVLCWFAFPVIRNMYWYQWINPLSGILSAIEDVTYWHPGYSEKAFASVELGLTQEEVKKIMGGPPLAETNSKRLGGPCWHYTTGQNGRPLSIAEASTHVRQICFCRETMKVCAKHYYFYWD